MCPRARPPSLRISTVEVRSLDIWQPWIFFFDLCRSFEMGCAWRILYSLFFFILGNMNACPFCLPLNPFFLPHRQLPFLFALLAHRRGTVGCRHSLPRWSSHFPFFFTPHPTSPFPFPLSPFALPLPASLSHRLLNHLLSFLDHTYPV